MLQTLGFDIAVEHPHTYVVKCCELVKADKNVAQTCYFLATNSLHLTSMCLQYKPTLVACICIHIAFKWGDLVIPKSREGKEWFQYMDESVTVETLESVTKEFLAILEQCPSKLKRKIMSGGSVGSRSDGPSSSKDLNRSDNISSMNSSMYSMKDYPSETYHQVIPLHGLKKEQPEQSTSSWNTGVTQHKVSPTIKVSTNYPFQLLLYFYLNRDLNPSLTKNKRGKTSSRFLRRKRRGNKNDDDFKKKSEDGNLKSWRKNDFGRKRRE